MQQHTAPKKAKQDEAPVDKRPYSRPVVKVLGKLHLLTQGTGKVVAEAGGGMRIHSDRRSKENIVRIADHPLGIGLYLFTYKPQYRDVSGHGRQLGVMADEVEAIMPEAVSVHPDGYKMVNYAMLGISGTQQ